MTDIREAFRAAEQIPAPTAWPDLTEVPAHLADDRPSRRRRLALIVGAGLVSAVGIALAVAAFLGLGGQTAGVETRPHIVAAIPVERQPAMVAVGEGAVWVAAFEGQPRPVLLRIDPQTNRVVEAIPLGRRGSGLGGLAVGAGAVWVSTDFDAGTIARVDPHTNRVVARIHVSSPSTLAVGFGSLWVGDFNGDSIVRVDPATNRPVARVAIGASPWALVAAEGYLWVLDNNGSVEKIDPATSVVTVFAEHLLPLFTEGTSFDLAVADGGVWIGHSNAITANDHLIRIDSRTGAVTDSIDLRGVTRVVVSSDGVWANAARLVTVTAKAIHRYPAGVVRIDPSTGEIVQRFAIRPPTTGLAVGYGALWTLSSPRRGVLYRIGPIDSGGH